MDLTLRPGLLEEVVEYARCSLPREACGLLVGAGRADRFVPMENVTQSSTEYEMDPAALAGVFRELRTSGETLIAICHSHPFGPAAPSKRDVERAYYPEAAHLIVSLADPERPHSAAFRIVDGEALEIELRVIV
jgi:proteasome lid subunit RPN8/RPN11